MSKDAAYWHPPRGWCQVNTTRTVAFVATMFLSSLEDHEGESLTADDVLSKP